LWCLGCVSVSFLFLFSSSPSLFFCWKSFLLSSLSPTMSAHTISVTFHRAENLYGDNANANPQLVYKIGTHAAESLEKSKGLNPVFNKIPITKAHVNDYDTIEITLLEKGTDFCYGHVVIPLSDPAVFHPEFIVLDLHPRPKKKEIVRGQIYITLHWLDGYSMPPHPYEAIEDAVLSPLTPVPQATRSRQVGAKSKGKKGAKAGKAGQKQAVGKKSHAKTATPTQASSRAGTKTAAKSSKQQVAAVTAKGQGKRKQPQPQEEEEEEYEEEEEEEGEEYEEDEEVEDEGYEYY